ncbi:MAG TPA: hypothetical protein VHG53_01590 [Candidatus Limnocylindria bacterium]|nr:hypothetical protein [Candidatus Limnocylindria bacterium]
MTESERALAALHLRARVALAIAILAFVGIARESELAGADIPARALVVGLALAAAAEIARSSRPGGWTGTPPRSSGRWPNSSRSRSGSRCSTASTRRRRPRSCGRSRSARSRSAGTYQLYLALVGGAIVVEIAILQPGSAAPDVIGALGWAALYVSSAALAGALGQSYRRAQRQTESAYASVATVTAATSYAELERILVPYAERALDLPHDAAAVLLFDDRGIGVFNA